MMETMKDRKKSKTGSYYLHHFLVCLFCVFALICVMASLYKISNAVSDKTSSNIERNARAETKSVKRSEDNIPFVPPGEEDVKKSPNNLNDANVKSNIAEDETRETYESIKESTANAKPLFIPEDRQTEPNSTNNYQASLKTLQHKFFSKHESENNFINSTNTQSNQNELQFFDNITRAFFGVEKKSLPNLRIRVKARGKIENKFTPNTSHTKHTATVHEKLKTERTKKNRKHISNVASEKQIQAKSGGIFAHEITNNTMKSQKKKITEFPTFPENYHASGLLILPHSNIAEPFEIWYAPKAHKSRIDYYYGTDKTFQRGDLQDHGVAYKYVPMYNDAQGSFDGCWTVTGTKNRPIIPQIITPNISWFKYDKDEVYTGTLSTKWKYEYSVYGMKNSQNVWITKSKPHRPIRYEMYGFDMMLGSYYDHYVINYVTFDEWNGNEDDFKLPEGVHCYNWTNSLSSSLIVNPMQEFTAFTPEQAIDANARYNEYKVKHNKINTVAEEEHKRKHIYKHNIRYVNSHNRKNLPYKLKENHFVDMSQDELNIYHGALEKDTKNHKGIKDMKEADIIEDGKKKKDVPPEDVKVPDELDWRDYGAVTSVKGQGICGACYAITAAGAAEGAWYRKTGKLVEVSSQQLVDCSWGLGNHGCKGGHYAAALSWIYVHGVSTKKSYGKYLGQEGYCHLNDTWFGANIEGFSYIQPWNKTALKRAVAKYGPIAVSINTSPLSFKFYSHGVYGDISCSANHTSHSVLVIGYGTQNGQDYWLIKNSWSGSWGDNGYMKITMDEDLCGITEYPIAVVVRNPQFRLPIKSKIKSFDIDTLKLSNKSKHTVGKAKKPAKKKNKNIDLLEKIQRDELHKIELLHSKKQRQAPQVQKKHQESSKHPAINDAFHSAGNTKHHQKVLKNKKYQGVNKNQPKKVAITQLQRTDNNKHRQRNASKNKQYQRISSKKQRQRNVTTDMQKLATNKQHRGDIQLNKVFIDVEGAALTKIKPSKIIHADQYTVTVPLRQNVTTNKFITKDTNSYHITKVNAADDQHPSILGKQSKTKNQHYVHQPQLPTQVKNSHETKTNDDDDDSQDSEEPPVLKVAKNLFEHVVGKEQKEQEKTTVLNHGKHLHNMLQSLGEKIENNENIKEEVNQASKLSPEKIGAYEGTYQTSNSVQSQTRFETAIKKLTIERSKSSLGDRVHNVHRPANPPFASVVSKSTDISKLHVPTQLFGQMTHENKKLSPNAAVKSSLQKTKGEEKKIATGVRPTVDQAHSKDKEVKNKNREEQKKKNFVSLQNQTSPSLKKSTKLTNYEKEAKNSMDLLYIRIDNAVKEIKQNNKPSSQQYNNNLKKFQIKNRNTLFAKNSVNSQQSVNIPAKNQYSPQYYYNMQASLPNSNAGYNTPRTYSLNLKNIFTENPAPYTPGTYAFFPQQNQNVNYG